ncbi:MAG: hypothetical protein M1816_001530 [Peltula sp. TS41687]|nr:MAG: hypothetical protein M1816_001530 [Peltula sp. TS41687]
MLETGSRNKATGSLRAADAGVSNKREKTISGLMTTSSIVTSDNRRCGGEDFPVWQIAGLPRPMPCAK